MLMLMHMDKIFAKSGKKPDQAPIGWVNNGLAFYIRDKNELVNKWLPIFFRQAKFSSFTRKLYRYVPWTRLIAACALLNFEQLGLSTGQHRHARRIGDTNDVFWQRELSAG